MIVFRTLDKGWKEISEEKAFEIAYKLYVRAIKNEGELTMLIVNKRFRGIEFTESQMREYTRKLNRTKRKKT